ncbi:MAG: LacI family transcriptional regulator [Anaerolineaceae bacterium]|nr:LacI family transcriptional regulator [Anaerolineaceae bacterium]
MPVTLKDVAAAAGYSVTTTSRALGGYDDVNEQTRERIITVARELGYQPNMLARQLQAQRAETIGLVIPQAAHQPDDDFFSLLMKGISYVASQHQFDLLISSQLTPQDELRAYQRIAGGRRVDGVIVARTMHDDPRIAYLQRNNYPFVVSGRSAPDEPDDFPFVDADSESGIRQVVAHFIDYGHEHIGFISSPPELAYTPYRLAGYQHALADADLPYREDYVAHGDMQQESGQKAAADLLARHPQMTAIVASNDAMAIGAMAAVQAAGKQVGVDMALGGFDDIPLARHITPDLTTVRQPIYRIGELVAEMLIQIINGEPPEQTGILLEPKLIIRASSGQPLAI